MRQLVAIGATIHMDYNLLKVFTKVAELGSFTKAGEALKQPKSRVSRAISRLESDLQVELFSRTTRRTSLTDAGSQLYKSLSPLLASIDGSLSDLTDANDQMSGVIRLTASEDIAQYIVSKLVSDFVKRYPKIRFETVITTEMLDLVEDEIDIAFRGGKSKDSSMKQRKLSEVEFIIVCSPDYAKKCNPPKSVDDLAAHKILSFKSRESAFLPKNLSIEPVVISDSFSVLVEMALNGLGVAILPSFVCEGHLENARLIRLLPGFKTAMGQISVVYPPQKNRAARVREFIDFSLEALSSVSS